MKRFFPSSVMLTPFLVKYYRHQEEYCPDNLDQEPSDNDKHSECDPDTITEQD
ncbi:hypothetical protein [Vibrio panuliri]|uniref:hypothetical protein n=1 Tax=Vibrio panuliri TaxID=1381081 RepID=UPI000B0626E3|nr:hypothetical protein [Vibrio panuliri]